MDVIISDNQQNRSYLCCWDPIPWRKPGEGHVRWNLPNYISNCPGSRHIIQLIAIEAKVLFPIVAIHLALSKIP
jgi:hypothetical protein